MTGFPNASSWFSPEIQPERDERSSQEPEPVQKSHRIIRKDHDDEQEGFSFISVLDSSMHFTPPGSPAPSVPRFDPATDVSRDATEFLNLVAGSISERVIDTFAPLTHLLNLYFPPINFEAEMTPAQYVECVEEREKSLAKALADRLGGVDFKIFDMNQKINVEVEPIMRTRMHDPRPPPTPLTADQLMTERIMKPDMRTVLPGRLLLQRHTPAAFEPSPELTSTLAELINEKAVKGLREQGGQEAVEMFQRAKKLVAQDMHLEGTGNEEAVCIFKLLEEKMEWAREYTKTEITSFDWKCADCGGRHTMHIDEKRRT